MPVIDLDEAVNEVERVAKVGYRSIKIPLTMASRPYNLPAYERFRAACAPVSDQIRFEALAIDAALRNGVRHVVKLSAYEAHDDNPSDFRLWNGEADRHLRTSGLDWTVLRPTAFCQSVDPHAIVAKGEILATQGRSTTPFIDARDIAVAVLTGKGHHAKIYDLTETEAFSQEQLAALIPDVFSVPIACRLVSDAEALAGLLVAGNDEVFARSMVVHWQSYRARPATVISGWTEILTGQPPRTLCAYLEEAKDGA